MSRYRKLAAIDVALTLGLVTVGVFVRATNSGLGCPDWPFCLGQVIPPLQFSAWIEWIHRDIAAVLGLLIVLQAALALVDHRDRPSIVWPSVGAVLLVGFQAWLGRQTVLLGNSGPSVTAHLAAAMALLGLLVYLLVRSGYPARIAGRGGSQRFTLLAAFGAVATFVLLLFGSNVTAHDAALIFPDWPLMGGTFFPPLTAVTSDQVLHRWVAVVVGLIVVGIAAVAWRTQRYDRPTLQLALIAGALYPIQAIVGGAQVLTQKAPWTQTLHVGLAAAVWAAMVGLTVASYYAARTRPIVGAGEGAGAGASSEGSGTGDPMTAAAPAASAPAAPAAPAASAATASTLGATIRAYVALTKPRIIELLLVTTIPAMVLATRDVPGIRPVDWAILAVWTIVGGSLAAGSANAINCYLDRDIDELMARTRRRPLPAHEVEPERAVVFGLVLGVVSIAVMAAFVNLVAAFLTLLAIAFYVGVYTMLLKRTTPQNIVIGGAAGALPPLIGWAAVTGSVGISALFLFAIVFYWTPPHFWALSLRIRKDYAAARIPMLPVVRGIPETTRQIGLYTILLVAISLVFFAVGRMGLIYLVTALVMGTLFLWRAYGLWRVGTSEEQSTAGAIRLYRFSISYLTLLFAAIALDALVAIPVG